MAGETAKARLKDTERRKVWVRAGGRCCLCKQYLLSGPLTSQELAIGEGAHVVGQKKDARSPRGLYPLPLSKRDLADNVMLLCDSCHKEVDHRLAQGLMTVEDLMRRKREHEDLVFHLTSLTKNERTVVLRMMGTLYGDTVELHQAWAAEAVIRSGGRFPLFDLSYGQSGVEIDLRDVPDEKTGGPEYYRQATAKIDRVIEHKLAEGVADGSISHLSVFGFARIPLLVYLGSRLNDNIPVDLYQRDHTSGSWEWAVEGPVVEFELVPPRASAGADAVLVADVSGPVSTDRLPAAIRELPQYTIRPVGVTPSRDILRRRESLDNFMRVIQELYDTLDRNDTGTSGKLHVVLATPLSAAVAVGQLHSSHLHPRLVVYQRPTDGEYEAAVEVSA